MSLRGMTTTWRRSTSSFLDRHDGEIVTNIWRRGRGVFAGEQLKICLSALFLLFCSIQCLYIWHHSQRDCQYGALMQHSHVWSYATNLHLADPPCALTAMPVNALHLSRRRHTGQSTVKTCRLRLAIVTRACEVHAYQGAAPCSVTNELAELLQVLSHIIGKLCISFYPAGQEGAKQPA